ncbi:ABC transporter ATP-binding protein [Gilvimarinus sp. 1_MG-2023]|uniref:ABC transporter ATP-binding protein n=1 Tax=Gilvimarinus sp. 1_MG-2023 TaxID=3062638 RepID=UPI0026E1FF4D|nr:ABC transporter ATP-binding protein [Gilvimarinus sp. 1_MG-2023]MDO6746550.1 ABC transporter ATP-binding protein [Gilvimarinus sp. 1_MG-2023]
MTYGRSPLLSLLLLLLVTLQALSLPATVWLTGYIIEQVISSNTVATSDLIIWGLLWWVSLSIGSFLEPWVGFLHHSISDRSLEYLQTEISACVLGMPDLQAFESKKFYQDLSFAQRNLEHCPSNFMGQVHRVTKGFLSTGGLVLVVLTYSPIVALIMCIAVIPHAVVLAQLSKYHFWNARLSTKPWREIQYGIDLLTNRGVAKEVRLFGAKSFFQNKIKINFKELWAHLHDARIKSTIYPLPTLLLMQAGSVVSFVLLVKGYGTGTIPAAAFVVVLQSLYASQGSVDQVVSGVTVIQRFLLMFKSIFVVLELEQRADIKATDDCLANTISVQFTDVSYSYDGSDNALKKVHFTIKQGEHIAIVGANGSGKTTLVNVLLGLCTPTSGEVLVNGQPLKSLCLDRWRNEISGVFQDFGKYEYSVRENIAFTSTGELDKSIADSLAQCGLAEKIPSLNVRLDRTLGDTDLSGGQWQRLAVARCIHKDARLYILDEPTASLDPIIESDIYTLFNDITQGKTSLMITHRLGSIKNADRILVMQNGEIVEEGSHQALIEKDGVYKSMYETQKDWYS